MSLRYLSIGCKLSRRALFYKQLGVGHSRIYSINCFWDITKLTASLKRTGLIQNEKRNTQSSRQVLFRAPNKLEQRKKQIQSNTRTKCHLVDPQAVHRVRHGEATDGTEEAVRRGVDLHAVGIVTGIKRNHFVEVADTLSLLKTTDIAFVIYGCPITLAPTRSP